MFDTLKEELTKTPEQLSPEKLNKAKSLATNLTMIRKIIYYGVELITSLVIFNYIQELTYGAPLGFIINIAVSIMFLIYIIFKTRDFLRGTI